jgi:hypothetical protein
MRSLTNAVSRHELADLLDVPLELVDALLDSGRVLCHVRRGEAFVPLDQLEAFFRDSLLRIYRSEARGDIAQHPSPSSDAIGLPDLSAERENAASEEEVRDESPRVAAATIAPEDADEEASEAAVRPIETAPPAETKEPPEQRTSGRYIPRRQLAGIFGETKFTILQLSNTGLRIRHNEPVIPGGEAKLSFALIKPARSVVVRARVVWTSLAKAGEEQFWISGLRVVEHSDRLVGAVETLKAAHELQPERRVQPRRATDAMTVVSGISDDEMALVTAAVEKFANDPLEASRWYSRARFALSDENVRRAAPQRLRDRDEVLGIWEYLDRQIEIGKIAGVVNWMRN